VRVGLLLIGPEKLAHCGDSGQEKRWKRNLRWWFTFQQSTVYQKSREDFLRRLSPFLHHLIFHVIFILHFHRTHKLLSLDFFNLNSHCKIHYR
jgi:hypothetical protein